MKDKKCKRTLNVFSIKGIDIDSNRLKIPGFITVFYQIQYALFYTENDAEVFPAHYTWKVAEKGFKMAPVMN